MTINFKKNVLLLLFLNLIGCDSGVPHVPIVDGLYVFQHKYAEHPNKESILLNVEIKEGKIIVTNTSDSTVWPKGLVEEGWLFLHFSKKWIITQGSIDEQAEEVGGCTGGPTVVDFEKKIYWTC